MGMVGFGLRPFWSILILFTSIWPPRIACQSLPGPFVSIKTHPDYVPTAINITQITEDRSLLAPGYYFVAPHMGNRGWGPQIIDQDGRLIWYGQPAVRKQKDRYMNAMNFQRCDYLGQRGNHLCFSEAAPDRTDRGYRSIGVNRILNNEYEPEGVPYSKAGSLWFPNPHEFQMLEGGNTFVQSVYQLREQDLRPYKGKRRGYIYDGCFQEIDVRTREEIFVWCSLDHFPLWHSMVFLNIPRNKENTSTPTGGKGTQDDPWDFVHLNGIDKNHENCYLVSFRHMNQILKIAGPRNVFGYPPGTIIWKFGGKFSTFDVPSNITIGYQHHARYLSTTFNETVFSVFDNRGMGASDDDALGRSSFKIFKVNNETGSIELLRMHTNRFNYMSVAQGSAELLPNDNALVGWGTNPEISEFHHDGTLLFHAKFYSDVIGLTNYRVYKAPWVGQPKEPPTLLAYCQTCNSFGGVKNNSEEISPLMAYVSWNGATEVRNWRFYLSGRKEGGIWIPAGVFPKTGFETAVKLDGGAFSKIARFAPFVSVEALNEEGKILATSVARTFVPQRTLGDRCDAESCFQPRLFEYVSQFSRSEECGETYTPEILGLIIMFFVVEGLDIWLNGIVSTLIFRSFDRDGYRLKNTARPRPEP